MSKRKAADILREGTDLVDVVMPNIFGEHGVPNYNSVVATFCHALVAGETLQVVDDKPLPLVPWGRSRTSCWIRRSPHAGSGRGCRPATMVSEVAERLTAIAEDYRTGLLPDLSDPFTKELFTPTGRRRSRITSRSGRFRRRTRAAGWWRP